MLVDALGGDGVVDVGDGGDARELLDLGAERGPRGSRSRRCARGGRARREIASGDRSAGRSSSTPACGWVFITVQLLVGQAAGLVEDLRRHGELADVVHEQPEAELAHALVEAVVAAAAAVVRPAVGAPGAAGDQQPEHGHLDAVAVRVVVEGGEVVERQRGVGAVEQVVDHRAGDVGERLDDRVRHAGAGAQRGARGGDRVAGRLVDLGARLGRQRLGDVDVVAEVVLDPDRADAGLAAAASA